MRTIAFLMEKGGTGKTTTTAGIAAGLNARGKSVLLIDLDPQQNLTFCVGMDVLSPVPTLHDVFMGTPAKAAVQPTQALAMDIITGGLKLASADLTFSGKVGREQLLKRSLEGLQEFYDFCLIDCPPSLGILTMNAATCADHILIPMTCDALSAQGLAHLFDFIHDVQTFCNPQLDISGLLLTKYDNRTIVTQALEAEIQSQAEREGTKVFNTRIRRSQQIKTAQAMQELSVYYSKAKAAIDYRALTEELLQMYEGKEQ